MITEPIPIAEKIKTAITAIVAIVSIISSPLFDYFLSEYCLAIITLMPTSIVDSNPIN